MFVEIPSDYRRALREALETTDTYNTLASAIGVSRFTLWRMLTQPTKRHQPRSVRKVKDWLSAEKG